MAGAIDDLEGDARQPRGEGLGRALAAVGVLVTTLPLLVLAVWSWASAAERAAVRIESYQAPQFHDVTGWLLGERLRFPSAWCPIPSSP